MPEIKPFHGILYNQAKVEIASVISPPYDVISPQQQNDLYEASPCNSVRLELGREEDRYSSAANYFSDWKKQKILIKDRVPSLYVLAQHFKTSEGKELERRGFIARCRLEEFGTGSILPHEKTLTKPKEDRFRLLQATKAMFSQIFGLYVDAEHRLDEIFEAAITAPPAIDAEFEGVRNRLWRVSGDHEIATIRRITRPKKILIADGHHRYETSLEFQNLMQARNPHHTGEEAYNFVMMYFTNIYDEGLMILPTHRIVHSLLGFESAAFLKELQKYFQVAIYPSVEDVLHHLRTRKRFAFGLVLSDMRKYVLFWLERPEQTRALIDSGVPDLVKDIDVTLLHKLVLEKILQISDAAQEQKVHLDYTKDMREAIAAVEEKKAQAAFLMNPTPIEQVRSVAEAGYTMPQKSTYFYPKLLSGVVVNSLDED